MTISPRLRRLLAAIGEEAAANPAFAARLEAALDGPAKRAAVRPRVMAGRRAPALVDPVALAQEGEGALREALGPLDREQLLDVVAQYGMDPGKLVMKWKDRARIVERIVEMGLRRATKGDAFRGE